MKIISARDNIFRLSAKSSKPEGYDEAKEATEKMGRREKVLGALGGPMATSRLANDRLALLGPKWRLKRDKTPNAHAYMAQRRGVGPDGQPVIHLATVGDPYSDEATVDHTVVRPDGSIVMPTTRKSTDAMHEPGWETSRGEPLGYFPDVSPGAKQRGQTFRRITQDDPNNYRDVPQVLSKRLPRKDQYGSLNDSLDADGLKEFDSGSLHGELSWDGKGRRYQWRHFQTPIAYVERHPSGGSSVVITSEGRDYRGMSGFAHPTRSLIYQLKRNAENLGHHVKYSDDWAPPQEHVDQFSSAGWERDPESGDFTYTTRGRHGNLVHLRATAIHNPGPDYSYYFNPKRYNLETYRGPANSDDVLPVNLNRHRDLPSVFKTPEDLIASAANHISKFGENSE